MRFDVQSDLINYGYQKFSEIICTYIFKHNNNNKLRRIFSSYKSRGNGEIRIIFMRYESHVMNDII